MAGQKMTFAGLKVNGQLSGKNGPITPTNSLSMTSDKARFGSGNNGASKTVNPNKVVIGMK